MSNSDQNARISVAAPPGSKPRVEVLDPAELRSLLPDIPDGAEYAVVLTRGARTHPAPVTVTLTIGIRRAGTALVFGEDSQVIVTVDSDDAAEGKIDIEVAIRTRLIVVWIRHLEAAAMDDAIFESAGPGDTSQVDAFLAADLPPVLQVGVPTELTVRLSREELEDVPGHRDAQEPIRIDPDAPLEIKLCRNNLRVVAGTRDTFELDCPATGNISSGVFHVVGVEPGEAVARITVRQGGVPFPHATLVLTVTVTSEPVSDDVPALTGTAPVERLDPRLRELPVLAVSEDLVAGAATLTFDLSLPNGHRRTYTSRSLGDKHRYLADLYDHLERLWELHKDETTVDGRRRAFDTELTNYGSALARDLLPAALRDDLAAQWPRLDGLAVVTTETDIPWELLTVEVDGGHGPEHRFLGEKGMTRWFCDGTHPTTLTPRRERRWFLCPDYPVGLRLPHLTSERDYLTNTLGAGEIVPGSADDLAGLLHRRDVDLLHFGGHGDVGADDGLPRLLLSGFTGQIPPAAGAVYSADRLAHDYPRLQDTSTPGPLVVLNACRAGRTPRTGTDAFAPAFLSGGAGAVLCCLWNVDDDSAAEFVHVFYETLRTGTATASEALTAARTETRKNATPAWLAYTLYAHPFATVDLTIRPEEKP